MSDVSCIEYDPLRKQLLVASKHNLIICKKSEDYLLNFNLQKSVQIDHEITCMFASENSQTMYFGTSTGMVLYCSYPLQIN